MLSPEKKNNISINLNCYLIRIRKKSEKDSFLPIPGSFDNKKFSQIAREWITFLDTSTYQNETKDRILYLEKTISLNDSYFSGIIKKGYSGQETSIDELKANKANTVNKIQADQFNSSPFYFLLCQPAEESTALIFLAQSYRQYGFKDLFEEAFKKFYKEKVSATNICEFSTLSIAKLFQMYVNNGDIRRLRFKKHTLTKNSENVLSDDENKNLQNYEMELSIIAKKKGFAGIKKNIDLDHATFIETVKIDGFDYDEAYADVSYANRKRVLNFSKPDDFSASFDLTEKVTIDPISKHPNFEILNTEALSLLQEEIIPTLKL